MHNERLAVYVVIGQIEQREHTNQVGGGGWGTGGG